MAVPVVPRFDCTKFTVNFGVEHFNFRFSYSTSVFPSILSLRHIFLRPPSAAAVVAVGNDTASEEVVEVRNVKPVISKKARSAATLINATPWSASLESDLSSLCPLSQTTFFQTMRHIRTPLKAYRFFNWAKDSGFTHSQHSYFVMLEILGRARNLNTARHFLFSIPKKSNNAVQLTDKFFNSLIRSYGDAGLFQESLKVFEVMKTMGIAPSAVTFNSLFLILFKRGRLGMVFELYDEMLRTYGVKPDVYTFNVLIKGFGLNTRVDVAFRMFKEMGKFSCEPDLITYNTLVDGLCRAGKVGVARNVVSGMLKKREDLRPNVVTYTTLLRGYCQKQEIGEALGVWKELVGRGIQPNDVTYNTIIQGLCESQNFDVIKEVLGKCDGEKSEGFIPDTCTFNTLINALCNLKNLDGASKIFEKMKAMHVKQDSATYSMLIRAFCQRGNFTRAEELLDELFDREILLCNGSCIPLVAAYNPIFEYLCTNGKTKKADGVFRQLMKRGVQDPSAFETLILGHCKEGTSVDGHKLLVLMLRRNFEPNIKIYESLINGLLQKQEANLAQDTLLKMLRSTHLPRTSTFHRILIELINCSSAHESANLMMLMLDKDIRPNISLSTDVVRLLFRNHMQDRAFQLVRSLSDKGYMANIDEIVSFLCKEKKLKEACKLVSFCLTIDQSVNVSLCNTVLACLCEARKLSEAFHLYYELLETGTRGPFSCLEDLKNGLQSEGKMKEAEFVAKRMPNLSS